MLGPQSIAWEVHAHFVGMLVGGVSSLLMQALHPRALAAVWDHSAFQTHLKERLGRTAYFVALTTYGATEEAMNAIERVNRIHAQIQGRMPDGTPYQANEPALLRWVHLTEVSSFLKGYQWLSWHALSVQAQDQYIQEMSRIGQLLGAPDLPQQWHAHEAAIEAYKPDLRFDERTREIVRVIENYPVDPWDKPFMNLVIQASFHLLPDWALPLLGRSPACEPLKQTVRQALRLAALPIQAFLDQIGRAHV